MAETTLPPNGPENLVLRYLRRIDERLDEVGHEQREQRARLASIEHTLAQEFAHTRMEFVRLDERLDRVHDRLGRIERRLDLIDVPAADVHG